MNEWPVFNYLPLENLRAFVKGLGNEEGDTLLRSLVGEEDCCFGNPCYHKACLACFCRGNIKFLTASQAYTSRGHKIAQEQVEYAERKAIIKDCGNLKNLSLDSL